MLRFLRCYSLYFTRHSELLRASLIVTTRQALQAFRHCKKEQCEKQTNIIERM